MPRCPPIMPAPTLSLRRRFRLCPTNAVVVAPAVAVEHQADKQDGKRQCCDDAEGQRDIAIGVERRVGHRRPSIDSHRQDCQAEPAGGGDAELVHDGFLSPLTLMPASFSYT